MGRDLKVVDALISECTAAGVVFHPRAGQLRPELTRGRPPDDLLRRVKALREEILLRLAEMMDFSDIGETPPLPVEDAEQKDETDEWRRRYGKTDSN